ncbi:MAG: hypothetical protein ABSF90_00160 [Syntrophobacteraceae bacterium]|jgi:hypothetical protein
MAKYGTREWFDLILPSVRQQVVSILLREVGERKELKHLEFGVWPKPSDG